MAKKDTVSERSWASSGFRRSMSYAIPCAHEMFVSGMSRGNDECHK